ncbi:hypothetical protein AWJ20_1776 [Sugiyamaella lignohabitans]|uniref:HPP transmembrane region domain-containing protein n=1 Tax=Sugiyamaella lignohabitans TaxID=796027 RepID=A0A167DZW1_9ASCO|nr:uncharacterized protein AWJ20_1776 [Sugiyamaella lignohabitans]ANB13483.1 hypothetical protein AWJ20_1776 [Sugiyamaella lignohabitans]
MVSRFFGHRPPRSPEAAAPSAPHEILVHLSVLISTFTGLVVIMAVSKYGGAFVSHHVPEIVPSWGASAILCYNVMNAPLAQPKNVLLGTFISSLIGVCLMKLWMTNPNNEDTLWLAGALSTAVSSVVMTLTNTLHPPAGAAALLPSVDDSIRSLGWFYLPVQIVSAVLMLGVACLLNNIVLQYPVYWWTPHSRPLQPPKNDPEPTKVESSSMV